MSGPWMIAGMPAHIEQPGLIWLASYPKSGNTWVRALLANLVKSRGQSVELNALRHDYFGSIASCPDLFEVQTGVPFGSLPAETVDILRPQIYRRWGSQVCHPTLVKVHDAWRHTAQGIPLFPEEHSLGCIYIVRNPLDVAVSMAPFYDVSLDEAIERLCDQEDGFCMKHDRLYPQLPQWMGDWSGHVESWIDSPISRKLVLRYEDMLSDTTACFRTLLEWSGIPFTESQLKLAVEAASFKNLQAKENQSGFKERGKSRTPFFRSGKAGGWREALTDTQIDRIISCHGRVMARLGYLDEVEKHK